MANQKAKAVDPKAAVTPVVPATKFFQMGKKKYAPRVEHNQAAWDKVQLAIQKGKGKASFADLAKVLEVHFNKIGADGKPEDHVNFISYMTRRGSLVEIASK